MGNQNKSYVCLFQVEGYVDDWLYVIEAEDGSIAFLE